MEEVAWRYIDRGDVASAEKLFNTLAKTFAYTNTPEGTTGASYARMTRLCRVISDAKSITMAQRHNDAVEALLEERFPIVAFFSTNNTEPNSTILHKWFLLVHPDKNPHADARKAFLRLADMKEVLVEKGLLGAIGMGDAPTQHNEKTKLPPVVNEQRVQREYDSRLKEFDFLLQTLKQPRMKLNCDLTFSSFEGTLRDMDYALECSDEEDADGNRGEIGKRPSGSGTSSTDVDEDALSRTVIMEGIAQSSCDQTIRSAVAEAFRGAFLSESRSAPPTSSSLGLGAGQRIVLKRPSSQQEWHSEQQLKSRTVTPQPPSPSTTTNNVTTVPRLPQRHTLTSSATANHISTFTLQSVLTSPFSVPLQLPAGMTCTTPLRSGGGHRITSVMTPLTQTVASNRSHLVSGKLSPIRFVSPKPGATQAPSLRRTSASPAQPSPSQLVGGNKRFMSPTKTYSTKQYHIPL